MKILSILLLALTSIHAATAFDATAFGVAFILFCRECGKDVARLWNVYPLLPRMRKRRGKIMERVDKRKGTRLKKRHAPEKRCCLYMLINALQRYAFSRNAANIL